MTTTTTHTADRSWVGGAVLIAIGLFLFAQQLLPSAGWLALGMLSAIFLVLYAVTRAYGFVVPGLILGGLSVGVALEEVGRDMNGSAVVLGLAAGFLGIYVVNALVGMPAKWWPLIPGGILAAVGGSQAVEGTEWARTVGLAWPLVLVAIGVVLLISGQRGPRRTEEPAPPAG